MWFMPRFQPGSAAAASIAPSWAPRNAAGGTAATNQKSLFDLRHFWGAAASPEHDGFVSDQVGQDEDGAGGISGILTACPH